jgi:hypothetical protein
MKAKFKAKVKIRIRVRVRLVSGFSVFACVASLCLATVCQSLCLPSLVICLHFIYVFLFFLRLFFCLLLLSSSYLYRSSYLLCLSCLSTNFLSFSFAFCLYLRSLIFCLSPRFQGSFVLKLWPPLIENTLSDPAGLSVCLYWIVTACDTKRSHKS